LFKANNADSIYSLKKEPILMNQFFTNRLIIRN